MVSRLSGNPRPAPDVRVARLGATNGLPGAVVERAVAAVAAGERAADLAVSITFLSSQRMRALNRRSFGRDRSTDVISFALDHAGRPVADVYICPAAARRAADRLAIPEREELIRLVVHGLLHALGWDHPEGPTRTRSAMWRRQERYVQRLRRSGSASS